MGRIVIACYKPKPGQEEALRALVAEHVATLRTLRLVTERAPIVMQAKDGTFVEVFEWASPEAIQAAHCHPGVLRLWDRFGTLCDFVPIAQVGEVSQPFSEFTPFTAGA